MDSALETDIRSFRRALRCLERFITSNVKDNSTCCGVTPTQCHLLLKVEEAGGISASSLSEYLGVDKSSLSRTVDTLIQSSLLRKKEYKKDRRYNTISLTEKGRTFVTRLNEECDAYYKPIYNALPKEIRERVLGDLEILSDAFSKAKSGPRDRTCCTIENFMKDEKEVIT